MFYTNFHQLNTNYQEFQFRNRPFQPKCETHALGEAAIAIVKKSLLDLLEALAVSPHHGVHCHKGLGVFVFHNPQNLLRFALVSHHHQDGAFVLGVPARAVDDRHATLHLIDDAVGHLFRLHRKNEGLHGLFVARQNQVDAIAAHAHHDAAVDEIFHRVAHNEAARDDDNVEDEDDAPLRDVAVFAHNHRNDVGAARTASLCEGHADAQSRQAATEDGRKEMVADERLHRARHHRVGDEMLQQRHKHRSHDDGIGRLDAESHADDFQCDEQQNGIDDEHGDTRGETRAPIHQSRDAAHAATHQVVRDEESRPAQAHGEQREGDDDITFYLF